MTTPFRLAAILAGLALLALAPTVPAQAVFLEDFNNIGFVNPGDHGPSGLIAAGWDFRNQSEPVAVGDWRSWGYAFEGAASLHVNQTVGDWINFNDAVASSWAILPAVPNQIAGDDLRFQLSSMLPDFMPPFSERLEVRYSPSGGTSTGSSAFDVGDFTTLLADIPDPLTHVWSETVLTLPGSGRIALRFFIPPAATNDDFFGGMQIDDLVVGVKPGGPCNLPLIPAPGQTVTWTAAASPHTICSDVTIPAGATVLVDAGATVLIGATSSLIVDGTFRAQGTLGNLVTIRSADTSIAHAFDVRGVAELDFCQVTCRATARLSALITIADCAFLGSTIELPGTFQNSAPPTVRIDRTSFVGAAFSDIGISNTAGVTAIRESTFTNSAIDVNRGYLLIDDVQIDGANLSYVRNFFAQDAYIDNVSVTNHTSGPALHLEGHDFLVGPNNTLLNNATPVRLDGGLLAGSVIPAAGNAKNHVDALGFGFQGTHWAKLDVPYVVGNATTAGSLLTIEPGTDILMRPDVALTIIGDTSTLRALGTPSEPITFRSQFPGMPWGLIKVASVSGADIRFEHCVFDGAGITALQADDSYLQADNCIFSNNAVGGMGTTFGIFKVQGSRFLGNSIGVQSSPFAGSVVADGGANPNAFVGNSVAVNAQDQGSTLQATGNWWGDATGPTHVNNPGGTGDTIAGITNYTPFLGRAPDFTDSPPVVRLRKSNPTLDAGAQVVISWDATDDGQIVSQKIFFSEHGPGSNFTLIADNLPPSQRSFELTVPIVPPSSLLSPSMFKVVAVDDAGHEGWDERGTNVPYTEDITLGTLVLSQPLAETYRPGENIQYCYTTGGVSGTIDYWIMLDGDEGAYTLGGGTTGFNCLPLGMTMPMASTDTARVLFILNHGAGNRREWIYSDYFSIRPDPLLGDAPPTVSMLTPTAGASFPGGGVVPISWTAADDEGLRSFFVQASYDGGHSFHRISDDLPGTTTNFNWVLPPTAGIPDVRVRVIAKDLRFQNSSDGADVAFSITPSAGGFCQADLGFGGPGNVVLSLCGDPLLAGGTADLLLTGAPANATAWLLASTDLAPTSFKGGTLVTVPILLSVPLPTDGAGTALLPGISGGIGPLTVYLQAVVPDAPQPQGFEMSNALEVEFLP